MNHRPLLRSIVFLFAAATGAAFFGMNYLPEPARMNLLARANALPMSHRYYDLKIGLAGLECDRRGLDVYVSNPCVTEQLGTQFTFNYPRTFLWLGRLFPLSVKDGEWLGPILDVAFLLAACTLFRGERFAQALYFCALLASPPVILSLERANVDIAFFCLILLAVYYVGRRSETGGWAATFCLGMLKIYPIAAIAGLIRNTKRSRMLFWFTVAAEGIFAALTLNNLRLVKSMTPQEDFDSFGYPVLPMILSRSFQSFFWMQLAAPALFAACALVAYSGFRNRRFWLTIADAGDARYRPLFLAGGAIYAAAFVMGANYDYRLIFLLFTLPFVFSLRASAQPESRAAAFLLAAIPAAYWLTAFPADLAAKLAHAVVTWALFLFFAPITVAVMAESLLPAAEGPPSAVAA